MSETYISKKEKNTSIPLKTLGKYAGIAAGVSLAFVSYTERHKEPAPAVINGLHTVYTAKPGDTEEGIGSRAYPDLRLDQAADLVHRQNPNPNHLIEPGQVFVFDDEAQIGKLVDPSAQTE